MKNVKIQKITLPQVIENNDLLNSFLNILQRTLTRIYQRKLKANFICEYKYKLFERIRLKYMVKIKFILRIYILMHIRMHNYMIF